MILAGDVGGTKVHLALYQFEHGQLVHVRDERFPAHEFSGLQEIVSRFLRESGNPEITAACFGVPGPVRGGRLRLTNLPWTLDTNELSAGLNITHLFLINDLEANGYGIPELTPEQIFTLNQGDPSAVGTRALVSAGTGLGEGVLEDRPAEALWRLRLHHVLTRNGGADDGAVRGALHLFDGIDGRQADNGGAVLGDCFDGARDGRGVDQWADGVVHQHDVVVFRLHRCKCASDGLLAAVSAFHHGDAASELILGDDGLDALDLGGTNCHHDGADLRHGGEGAQTVDQDRDPGERLELLGGVGCDLSRCHAGAQARRRKNYEDTHKKLSIPGWKRRRIEAHRRPRPSP